MRRRLVAMSLASLSLLGGACTPLVRYTNELVSEERGQQLKLLLVDCADRVVDEDGGDGRGEHEQPRLSRSCPRALEPLAIKQEQHRICSLRPDRQR